MICTFFNALERCDKVSCGEYFLVGFWQNLLCIGGEFMNFKKSLLCVSMMIICMCTSVVYAENVIGGIENNDNVLTCKYDNIVKEYVLQQRNCIDNGVKFVEDENVSEELNNYLRIQETTRDLYLPKEKYNAVAKILEKEQINDVIYFKVNVEVNWVYEGSTDG